LGTFLFAAGIHPAMNACHHVGASTGGNWTTESSWAQWQRWKGVPTALQQTLPPLGLELNSRKRLCGPRAWCLSRPPRVSGMEFFRICILRFLAMFSPNKPDNGWEVGPGCNTFECSKFLIALMFGLRLMTILLGSPLEIFENTSNLLAKICFLMQSATPKHLSGMGFGLIWSLRLVFSDFGSLPKSCLPVRVWNLNPSNSVHSPFFRQGQGKSYFLPH